MAYDAADANAQTADSIGNLQPTQQNDGKIMVEDVLPPLMVEATTLDTDGNGRVNEVSVRYSEAVGIGIDSRNYTAVSSTGTEYIVTNAFAKFFGFKFSRSDLDRTGSSGYRGYLKYYL